uniref:Uncharacterized protein n=1 Tax=Arundo donax TaxID=35708 RepID=A0A0A9EIY9_ARUDO
MPHENSSILLDFSVQSLLLLM